MYCENCGTQLENGVNVCPNCGKAVGKEPIPPTFSQLGQQSFQGQRNSQMSFQGQQPDYRHTFQGKQENNTQTAGPGKRIVFTPEEQKVLKSGCNIVSYTYLGYAIFCSLCALMFLIFSIVCISDAYYYGPSNTIFSVAAFLDFTGVLIAFYIKFAEYRKYAKCVDGDTGIIINKFRDYNIAGGIVLSILFFWPAIVPVILTSTKINDPIKRMTASLML